MEHFGFKEGSRALKSNGEKDLVDKEGEAEDLDPKETTIFRGLAARVNFLSLDCPDLQFPVKVCSREMADPTRGSWKSLKKIARYLVGRESVVWGFEWQEEPDFC